jgi:hypothetical protein
VTILYFTHVLNEIVFITSIYAGALNIINFLAASLAFKWTLKKDNKKFLRFNLGGMGVRLFFLLCSIFILLNFLKIDIYAFILVFFVFYFVFLIVEVNYFHKSMESAKKN